MIPDTYDVCALTLVDECRDMRDRITFRSCMFNDGTVIPPPSSELIRLHAACVKIAHMSGAIEMLDKYDRDTIPFQSLSTSAVSSDFNIHSLDELDRALRQAMRAS